ncbi:hypothetical protein [Desulfosporosinus metallidurans]|uniref:hypothetical protein n=1 Tax=Desulfosporosinus metallidurans TaxID=1888891 RepID=UPI00094DDB45|nr:hypothetical protein [Desulfosporosinus metallidurans]
MAIDEDIDFIHDYPVLLLNGYKNHCASKLAGQKRSKLGAKSRMTIGKMTETACFVTMEIPFTEPTQ